jgi:hypothetical protein
MKGIPCNSAEFDLLQTAVHNELKKSIKGYKKNTVKWADKKLVPFNKSTNKYLFPVSKGMRWGVIKKLLSSPQKTRIIEVLPNDKNWFNGTP